MKVWIVIPAYNEETSITRVIDDVRSAGYESIIVVDDGSVDGTYEAALSRAAVARHAVNRGYGAALVTGSHYAVREGADIIVHFDADGQHRAADIRSLVQPISQGRADIALGSRYLLPDATPWLKKHLIHRPAILVQNLLTGIRLTDAHNGLRAFSRDAALRLRAYQDGMAYASEIINEIKRLRLRYVEVPVTIRYERFGQGFAGGVRIYRDLIIKKLFK